MADDIQLQVGIDLDALKQSAERGASVLGQAFQGAMSSLLSGHTLGSGVAPSQLPPGQAPAQQMLSVLSHIEQTLQQGFSALIGVFNSGGSGVGGPSGASGTGRAPVPPGGGPGWSPPATPGRQETWGQSTMAGLRFADQFPMSSFANMIQTDFHRTGVYQFLSQALGSVPVVGKLFGLGAEYAQASDEFMKQSLDVFRSGGRDARRNFRGVAEFESGHAFLKQVGITLPEYANMQISAATYGSSAADPLAALQGRYGLADRGSDLMRTLVQGGGTIDKNGVNDIKFKAGETEWRTFADVLAVAIGTNLDRGRWGEAFTALSAAARRISTGNIDKEGLLATETFVGGMGARFQGDSSAHTSMVAALQGLQSGQGGGLAQIIALQAGGLAEGGSYFDAQARVDLGAAAGGISLEDVLRRYANLGFVQAYMQSGTEADLNRAYILLSRMLPGYKPTDIKEMLRALRAQGGVRGPTDVLRATMGRSLGSPLALHGDKSADFLPKQEGEVIGSAVSGSFKGADATSDLIDRDEDAAARRGGGIGGIENPEEARAQGGFRTAPPVVTTIGDSTNRTSSDFLRTHVPTTGSYGAVRSDTAFHPGVDITGLPGAPVYCPCNGIILNSAGGTTAHDGAPGFGLVIKEDEQDGGRIFRIFHIDPKSVNRTSLGSGRRVSRGQQLGRFFNSQTLPGTRFPTHVHVGVQRPGARGPGDNTLDPASQINLEDVVTKPNAQQSPSTTDAVTPQGATQTGPLSSNERMDVHIFVHDTRVSVARRIVRGGVPGQNFSKRG